jgi:hypothetical protein
MEFSKTYSMLRIQSDWQEEFYNSDKKKFWISYFSGFINFITINFFFF